MRFLNGFKTAIGTVGLILVALSDTTTLTLLPEKVRPYVAGGAAVLTALGLIHKYEKKVEQAVPEPQ